MEAFMFYIQKAMPYKNEVNFLIFIPLFFVLRSILLRKLNKVLYSVADDNQTYPFLLSLVNWATFYAITFYAIVYFRDTFWLGKTWFTVGDTSVNTMTFVIPLIIISLAVKFSNLINSFFMNKLYDSYDIDQGTRYNFNRLIQYSIIIVAVLVALPTVGFNISVLTVFAGVLGIGIGFGISNIVSNFISGLIIFFERPIKIGDRIKLGDLHCDVEHINIRSTVVRTRNNEHIIIPNTQFIESQVMNWSYGDPKIRGLIMIGVAYGSDVRLVEKLLLQAAGEQENVLDDPAPRVDFLNFGDSALELRLLYWIPDPTPRTRIKSAINFRINELFREYDVEIPFPQRDLHVRSLDTELIKNLQVKLEQDKHLLQKCND